MLKSTKINWKDPNQALTKLYPRQSGDDDDDMSGDPGSFFNFFEHEPDPSDVCVLRSRVYIFSSNNAEFLGWPINRERNFPRSD